ncbi:hypothetical protein E1181_29370 [Saccharopolyspora terrae]|uniref:Dihydrodiol dehydrogenase n=1 Tax=Saccharopolyspora terrae TaxID=2530384 RepID=A0A4R4VC71_9PSEU|nr:hypothetical protein [Saccharopolyspora terrae]TDC99514.1 hypothetical protein E1181_29370 [Saccharopolyspora terrae]
MADNDLQRRAVTGPDSTALVGSEFAEVAISVDGEGNGPRLRLEDLRSGRVRFLDALELETIIWLPEGHLRQLLDPASDRWREDA